MCGPRTICYTKSQVPAIIKSKQMQAPIALRGEVVAVYCEECKFYHISYAKGAK